MDCSNLGKCPLAELFDQRVLIDRADNSQGAFRLSLLDDMVSDPSVLNQLPAVTAPEGLAVPRQGIRARFGSTLGCGKIPHCGKGVRSDP